MSNKKRNLRNYYYKKTIKKPYVKKEDVKKEENLKDAIYDKCIKDGMSNEDARYASDIVYVTASLFRASIKPISILFVSIPVSLLYLFGFDGSFLVSFLIFFSLSGILALVIPAKKLPQ